MCFNKALTTKHRIADSNVTCYKIMILLADDKLESLCYPKGKTYSVGDTMVPDNPYSIEWIDNSYSAEEGVIHSYLWYVPAADRAALGNLFSKVTRVVVQCVIPKGTAFWRNRIGECISDKLVLKSIIR